MSKQEKLKAFEYEILNLKSLAEHDLRKLQSLNFRHGSGFKWANAIDLLNDIYVNCVNSIIRKEALETYTNYIRNCFLYERVNKFLLDYDSSYKSIINFKGDIKDEH